VDHLLAGVALNRVDEVREFLTRHGSDISSQRLLSALYAAMMCGHDVIAFELSKYAAAAKTTRGDPGVEPVIFLCWTLLCVGWCATTEDATLYPSPDDLNADQSTMKFRLQHLDEVHPSKVRYFQDAEAFGIDMHSDYAECENFWNTKHRGYNDYCQTVVDARHLKPAAEAGFRVPWRGLSYDMSIRLHECAGLNNNLRGMYFEAAKYYKRVVDSAFGDDLQRMPNDAIYTGWHEWWLAECATRPSKESRAVLLAEGPDGCSVSTLLSVISALPSCAPTAILRQHVNKFAMDTFKREHKMVATFATRILHKPHWEIANPDEYNRLARDLMQSQSSNWITSSRDVRASTIVMAGLDVFVRPLKQIQAESFDEHVGALVRLTDWPARSPLRPNGAYHAHSCPGARLGHINRGLVFVSDCDPSSFDLTDIPPTGLLPMHTLIAHRVKAEYGDLRKSGKIEDWAQASGVDAY
jgi:hypothetical protein